MTSGKPDRQRSAKRIIVAPIQGPVAARIANTAIILGTNESVCSWIWVVAEKMATATPMISESAIEGIDTTMVMRMASFVICTMKSWIVIIGTPARDRA